jgi:hypothetical protein
LPAYAAVLAKSQLVANLVAFHEKRDKACIFSLTFGTK